MSNDFTKNRLNKKTSHQFKMYNKHVLYQLNITYQHFSIVQNFFMMFVKEKDIQIFILI